MIAYLSVALGSALGGVARYGFGLAAARLWGETFPWGTIIINVVGSFVIGLFAALTLPSGPLPAGPNLRAFVMVGLCGGFTTFSSFSLQTFALARDGSWIGAAANVLLSVALCLVAVTLGHVAAERIGVLRSEASSMSRHIVAVLDRTETARPVLAAAALAADRLGTARIAALHVRPDAEDGFMPTEEVTSERRGHQAAVQAARQAADLHGIFEAWRRTSGQGEWRDRTGGMAQIMAAEATGADLVVVGRPVSGWRADANQALLAALFDVRRPTLVVPEAMPTSLGQNVALAWKPSEAADRATEAALPVLLRAEQVTVLIGAEDDARAALPAALLQRLAKAAVPVAVDRFETHNRRTGEMLLSRARLLGADLLVMGAYTRPRVAEFVFGGATREIFAAADLPVLMHH